MEITCPYCRNTICHVACGTMVMSFKGRDYVMRDLLFAQCERCDQGWQPQAGLSLLQPRAPRNFTDMALPEASNLYCQSPGCNGKILANLVDDMAVIAYRRRMIVVRALVAARCDNCKSITEPPLRSAK